MKLKYNFHFQPVGTTFVGTAIGADARAFGGIIQLNEVGYDIVRRMQEEITREQLIEAILGEYDTDAETAGRYIDDVVAYLVKEEVLIS